VNDFLVCCVFVDGDLFSECINTASFFLKSVFKQLERMLGFRDGWGRWAPHWRLGLGMR